LLQQAQILKLQGANDTDLKVLQDWLSRREGGDGFLRGREASPWENENTMDLVSLDSRNEETDRLTLWIYNTLVPWFHNRWGHRIKVSCLQQITFAPLIKPV
jgi:hypothetical protein